MFLIQRNTVSQPAPCKWKASQISMRQSYTALVDVGKETKIKTSHRILQGNDVPYTHGKFVKQEFAFRIFDDKVFDTYAEAEEYAHTKYGSRYGVNYVIQSVE